MESFEAANRFKRVGRFPDALIALGDSSSSSNSNAVAEVLRVELLEAVGQHHRAASLANSLLQSRRLPALSKSACQFILGKIETEEGNILQGINHLQRSVSHAREAAAFDRLFMAQLKLMAVVSETSGPDAAAGLLADVRALATRLGDPHVTAKLHLFVAEMEAKRGLLHNARKHSAIAQRILSSSPNAYLQAFCHNLDLAVDVLLCQFDSAQAAGKRAAELAELSGATKLRRAVLGNMGSLFCEIGQFDRAIEYFERALAVLPPNGTHTSGILDGMARLKLLQHRLDECSDLLDTVEASIRNEEDRALYCYRYAALTRAQLLAAQGRSTDAIDKIEAVSAMGIATGDALLVTKVELVRATLMQRLGRMSECVTALQSVKTELVAASPETLAHIEQIVACGLLSQGDRVAATVHRDRSARIYKSVRNVTGQLELERCWNITETTCKPHGLAPSGALREGCGRTVQDLAVALAYSGNATLVARQLVDILCTNDYTHSVRATSRFPNGAEETIAVGDRNCNPVGILEEKMTVGFDGERQIELSIAPKNDLESIASLRAVRLILNAIEELGQARLRREHEAMLWPLEEVGLNDERSVITGSMRTVMNDARRIARTKVNVLITGESGTGKEIVARAIHEFSDRASKAFVPFNCTAIPRDLLESQLFGHRRGAFTGADRDQLGLIRSARDGTLFLDEVGEMGLDLQPKLLRFLESGEISPLGEPSSLTIDVRIVAATNANLEDAVRAGRFREDLFYRLNVVRLTIPPLRERRDEIPGFVNHFVGRAADEFKKGAVRVAEETMERLLLYRWPGNVRQLQNEMRRMVALAESDSTLLPHAISEEILGALPIFHRAAGDGREIAVDLHDKLIPAIARVEREMITAAMRRHDGKVQAVATALGISRKGLYLKRQRLGL